MFKPTPHDTNADQLVKMIAEEEKRRDVHLKEADVSGRRIRALQQALDTYQSAAMVSEGENQTLPPTPVTNREKTETGKTKGRRSGSRFAWVMERIKEAGERGMAPVEMRTAAAAAGVTVNANTIRSQVWHAKKAGKLENVDGRYRVPQSGAKTEAPPDKESEDASNNTGEVTASPNEGRSDFFDRTSG